MLRIGQIIEIKPGYNSDTGERDNFDEIAACMAQIVGLRDGDMVDVVIAGTGDEYEIHAGRVKLLG